MPELRGHLVDGLAWVAKAEQHSQSATAPEGNAEDTFNRFGRYVLLRRLGAGGMGVVDEAYDPQLGRKVALKRVKVAGGSTIQQAQLIAEAKAMAQLGHPNVVSIFDIGEHAQFVYLAMELVEGTTLEQRIHDNPPTWRELVAIMADVARGLAAAHEIGLVHRDVKPANILLGADGRTCIADFGLARVSDEQSEQQTANDSFASHVTARASRASTHQIAGTPSYMAPEQHAGYQCDAQADQFSFCVSFYEVLFGTLPFVADEAGTIVEAIARGCLQSPRRQPRAPRWLHALIVRGLDYEAERRFPSMQALLDELLLPRTLIRRRRVAMAAASVLCLLGVQAISADVEAEQSCALKVQSLVDSMWSTELRADIRRSFATTDATMSTWHRVDSALEDYARQSRSASVDACEHARIEDAQATVDATMVDICLQQLGAQFGTLTRLFSSADSEIVDKAVPATLALPDIAGCNDLQVLGRTAASPISIEARTWAAETNRSFGELNALIHAGQIAQALDLLDRLTRAATKVQHHAKLSELHQKAARLIRNTPDRIGALEHGQLGLEHAQIVGDDVLAFGAAIELIYMFGYMLGQLDDAGLMVRSARASLERLNGRAPNIAGLYMNMGTVAFMRNQPERALAHYSRAVDAAIEEFGERDTRLARILVNLAYTYEVLGRPKQATGHYNRAIAIFDGALGPNHPGTILALTNLAGNYRSTGRALDARAPATRALQICQSRLGESSIACAAAVQEIALMELDLGELNGARERLARMAKLQASAGQRGKRHANWAHVYAAWVELERGRADRARTWLDESEGLFKLTPDLQSGYLVETAAIAIRVALALDDRPEAAAQLEAMIGYAQASSEAESFSSFIAIGESHIAAYDRRWTDCNRLTTRAIELRPHHSISTRTRDVQLLELQARARLKLNDLPGTRKSLDQLTTILTGIEGLRPHVWLSTHQLRAETALAEGSWPRAREYFGAAIEAAREPDLDPRRSQILSRAILEAIDGLPEHSPIRRDALAWSARANELGP